MGNKGFSKSKRLKASLRHRYRHNKPVFVLYFVLRIIVVAALVLSLFRWDLSSAFICALALVLFLVPAFIERHLRIELPTTLQIIILLFIFAAEILGELSNYYVRYTHWDTILHITWGFICAGVGYSLVDLFNRDEHFGVKLSPVFLAITAVCFSMTIGILWEFFEFSYDFLFQGDMQKDTVLHTISSVMLDPTQSNTPVVITNITEVTVNGVSLGLGGYLDIGLYDTMKDLFINFVGAVVFCVIASIGSKKNLAGRITSRFIPRVKKNSEIAHEKRMEELRKQARQAARTRKNAPPSEDVDKNEIDG